jgi:hypothetical protein
MGELTTMDRPLLNDKDVYPDDEVLHQHLGGTKVLWDRFTTQLYNDFSGVTLEWRYYNDGKAWLAKVVQKKKTMCWVSVWERFFKVTFYFMEKNDKDIAELPIDRRAKERYLSHKGFGKLKPLTFEVKTKKALEDVMEAMRYKSTPPSGRVTTNRRAP